MIVHHGIALCLAFFVGFVVVSSLLRPFYQLPSIDIVRNDLLPKLYGKVSKSIDGVLIEGETSLFALHLDGWSDNAWNGIVGISFTGRFLGSILMIFGSRD